MTLNIGSQFLQKESFDLLQCYCSAGHFAINLTCLIGVFLDEYLQFGGCDIGNKENK